MLDAIRWDADLIHRYDQAGPRYRSYPSRLQFGNRGCFELPRALGRSRQAGRLLSLYLHLPFCANPCYHWSCNKVITKDRDWALPYLERLENRGCVR